MSALWHQEFDSSPYTYDYAGRLRAANNNQALPAYTQSFTYDGAGRIRANSRVGTYAYANATVARHAPSTVTPAGQAAQALVYDLNGNMLTGLDGKVMTYDGENRPQSVTFGTKRTCYVYGADGARLKKIEGFAPATPCTTPPTAAQKVTLYMGPVEIRGYGTGNAEEILLYPHPSVRISKTKDAGGAIVTKVSTLHRDALGSVRAVTTAAGLKAERATYRPYGEQTEGVFDIATAPETKGFIGERYDADAGLQYLNARYYDPKLAMIVQPDWWEVTKAGVGTNRYAYSFDDPVNGTDAGGHYTENWFDRAVSAVGSWLENTFNGGKNYQRDAVVNAGKSAANAPIAYVRALGSSARPYAAAAAENIQYYGSALDFAAGSGETVTGVGRLLEWLTGSTRLGTAVPSVSRAFSRVVGPAVPPAISGTENSLTRVGRWMSSSEYNKMTATGRVVESASGKTSVANPASVEAFARQAPSGSVYVEFSVESSSLAPSSSGWSNIVGPNSLQGRLAAAQGNPIEQMPEAFDIVKGPAKP